MRGFGAEQERLIGQDEGGGGQGQKGKREVTEVPGPGQANGQCPWTGKTGLCGW